MNTTATTIARLREILEMSEPDTSMFINHFKDCRKAPTQEYMVSSPKKSLSKILNTPALNLAGVFSLKGQDNVPNNGTQIAEEADKDYYDELGPDISEAIQHPTRRLSLWVRMKQASFFMA